MHNPFLFQSKIYPKSE